MQTKDKKILLIAGKGFSTNVIFHAVNENFAIHSVIIEEKESTKVFLKRRVRKLGFMPVLGQVLFQAMIVPLLRFTSSKYVQSLIRQSRLNESDIDCENIHPVNSANQASSIELVKQLSPDIIIVNGTRILSKKLLGVITCPVINMHAGITPQYRGVHGAYWALANNDKPHCGVTVHLVDAGVDTGDVLYQATIEPGAKDNFISYPVKQLSAGLPLLLQAVKDAMHNELKPSLPAGSSTQWYHPTIWKYLYLRLAKGVK